MTQQKTLDEVKSIIAVSKDSVWVIETRIEEIANGKPANKLRKSEIDSNVRHLKNVIQDEDVINSGENINDLVAAIALGEAKLAEDIWPV